MKALTTVVSAAVVLGCIVPTLSLGAAKKIDLSRLNLIAGCRVHNSNGLAIREFAGNYCLFFTDGRYLSADATRLAMVKSDKTFLWQIPGHYHHQLNWSADKKHVLALTSNFEKSDGLTIRIDVLKKIDLDGKVVAEISSRKIFDDLKITRIKSPFDWDPSSKQKADHEISHFNSFYEIPAGVRHPKMSSVVGGNFIANSTHSAAVIISSNFKTALARVQFPSSILETTHDVQITKDAQVLFLNNEAVYDELNSGPRTTIETMDPFSKKNTYRFQASPPEMFYTPLAGGVQQVGDEYLLISHITNAYFFLERKTGKIVRSNVFRDAKKGHSFRSVQDIRAEDLSEFLSHWQ